MNITYLIDRLAESFPDDTAMLLEDGNRRSWRETRDRVERIAAVLRSWGLAPGDRVALLALNGPHFLEASWAVARLGAVLQPMNFRLAPAELAFQIADAAPKLLLLDTAFGDLAEQFAGGLETIVIDPAAGSQSLEALMKAAEPGAPPAALSGDETLGIFYTSGTTGTPKGVMISHANVLANAAFLVPTVGYSSDDVTLHAAPMFHVSDFCASFAQLIAGGQHAFIPRFQPEPVLAAVARYRATNLILIPAMIDMVVDHPAVGQHDLSSWRFLFYGGSPIAAEAMRRYFEVLPCELAQGYGLTESTHTICVLTQRDHRRATEEPELLRSCGRPLIGVHVRIADDAGKPLPPGEIGEILVRAPNVMKGYWNDAEATEEVLRGGWLHTGDVGFQDAGGYVTLVDRKKDMIISGGENVYSVEVENALASHPAVAEAATIAVPDDKWGERVHAVIVLAEGHRSDADDLQSHCRQAIAGYKIPRSFEFVDSLPRTGIGKVKKSDLRKPHWKGRERMIQ